MAMFAMIAGGTYLGSGFFTPLYHIAAFIIGPETMMKSMESGTFFFSFGPAVLGMMIHLMTALAWGIVFAVVVSRLGARGGALVVIGAVYGLIVMALMSFIALPLIGQGEMPKMVGWPTFSLEHALYGATLGVWLALSRVPSEGFQLSRSTEGVPGT